MLFVIGLIVVLLISLLTWFGLAFDGYEYWSVIMPIVMILGYIMVWWQSRHGFKHKGVYIPVAVVWAFIIALNIHLKYDERIQRIPTVASEIN